MEPALYFKALFLGVVEGLTEFLPVSSTGHLIIAGQLIGFNGEKAKVFDIVIQLAAILAVCWEYRGRLRAAIAGITTERMQQRFVANLAIAFTPAAVLGLLFHGDIKRYLFHPLPVATAFVAGGLLIIWAERRAHRVTVERVDDLRWQDALKIGFAQTLALIPGTSRSGATIIGGLFFALTYFNVVNVDLTSAQHTYDSAREWLTDQATRFKDVLLAHLPSSASGGVGAFIGEVSFSELNRPSVVPLPPGRRDGRRESERRDGDRRSSPSTLWRGRI